MLYFCVIIKTLTYEYEVLLGIRFLRFLRKRLRDATIVVQTRVFSFVIKKR